MQMPMMDQRLAPRVEHSKEADRSAEMLRIACDGLEGLDRGVEQDAVDHASVLQGNGCDWLWHREDDVEVFAVQ